MDYNTLLLFCIDYFENSANKKKTKTFSNTPKGFEQLQIWLNQHAATSTQTIILMEATSIYHELLAKYLFDEGYQVSVINPARARYFAQSMSKLNKTDKVDSEILARFAMTANLHFWQPLPKHIQLLNAQYFVGEQQLVYHHNPCQTNDVLQ